MKKVFIDTAGWLALGNKNDRWHSRSVQVYQQAVREMWHWLTTDAVIIEVCNVLRKPSLRPLALVLTDNIYKAERWDTWESLISTPTFFAKDLRYFGREKTRTGPSLTALASSL